MLSIVTLAGCTPQNAGGSSSETPSESPSSITSETPSSEDAKTTMTDRSGEEFTLPAKMDKIISTAPSNTEVLIGLGMGENLAVVDSYSADIEGVPDDVLVIDFRQPDIEALLEANCDILIASEHNMAGTEDPYHQIKSAGIPVVYLPTSISFEEIYKDIDFLGELTNTKDVATNIIADMKTRIEAVVTTVKDAEPKSVYMEIGPAPSLFSAGKGTFLDEAITLAGGANIFGDQEGWVSPSEESVITLNPDVIITNVDYVQNPIEEIKARAGWGTLQAVENNRIVLIDSNASSRCSQNVVIALEELAKAIHPDLFS